SRASSRSSIPSYLPASSTYAVSSADAASSATRLCTSGVPAGDRCSVLVALHPSAACAARAAASVFARGSASITIPGPPPYGRSSTVRYLSATKSRGFQTPRRHNPRSSALPVTPNRAAWPTISGNSVTTSILIRSEIFAPIDVDPRRIDIHPIDDRRHEGDQPFCAARPGRPRHPQQRMRAVLGQPGYFAEQDTCAVSHGEACQVVPAVLAVAGRGQRASPDADPGTLHRERGFARIHAVQRDEQRARMQPPVALPVFAPVVPAPLEPPRRMAQQRFGRRRERPDLDRAAHSVR